MLKFLFVVGLIALAKVSASPHGQEYLASLTPEQLRSIPREVLEDALLDVVSICFHRLAKYVIGQNHIAKKTFSPNSSANMVILKKVTKCKPKMVI